MRKRKPRVGMNECLNRSILAHNQSVSGARFQDAALSPVNGVYGGKSASVGLDWSIHLLRRCRYSLKRHFPSSTSTAGRHRI